MVLKQLSKGLGNQVSRCELMSQTQLAPVRKHYPHVVDPLPETRTPWYIAIEVGFEDGFAEVGTEAVRECLASALEVGTLADVVLSASDDQARRLWEIREIVSDANR